MRTLYRGMGKRLEEKVESSRGGQNKSGRGGQNKARVNIGKKGGLGENLEEES